ncbi:HIT family protein [Hydrogenimonas sp.]
MIYEDDDFTIEWEKSEIPWVKIFTKEPYKELTDCPAGLRERLWGVYEIVERTIIEYYRPDKVNMASFGNYVPRVHIHVMARFEIDSWFPEPIWGAKQREGSYEMGPKEPFEALLKDRLKEVKR